MKKYTKPAIKVVEIESCELMAGSEQIGKAGSNADTNLEVLGKGASDDDWD